MKDPEIPEPSSELSSLYDAARRDPVLSPPAMDGVVRRAARPPRSWGWPAVGAAVVLALLGWLALGSPPPPRAPSPPPSPVPVAPEAPSPIAPSTPPAAPAPSEPASPREERRAPVRAEAPARVERSVAAPEVEAAAPAPADDGLSEGLLLLRARAALVRDPAACLALAEQHRERFPDGAMTEEREVLAIEALAALDRSAEAQARAARFGARFVGSPYARRVATAIARTSP